jgi:putative ubiquitin-RnfH superfamily antitoxin RatB of RatAB toxin-antitoxin module
MDKRSLIHVQVCYAKADKQLLHDLTVSEGTTLHEAIKQSGVQLAMPEIDLISCRVGVYGKLKALDTVLQEGDRVEIYRPLIAGPNESRRRRAQKKEGDDGR